MPNQTRTAINIGDTLDEATLHSLPVGAVVRDKEDDHYDVHLPGHYVMRGDGTSWSSGELVRMFSPVRLVSVPPETPDTYQQARLALRERMVLEPAPALVVQVQSIIENHGVDGETAVSRHLNHVVKDDAEAALASGRDQTLADLFVVIVAHGADANSRVVVSADTTPGLARLRAHAALDNLLDQHGISR